MRKKAIAFCVVFGILVFLFLTYVDWRIPHKCDDALGWPAIWYDKPCSHRRFLLLGLSADIALAAGLASYACLIWPWIVGLLRAGRLKAAQNMWQQCSSTGAQTRWRRAARFFRGPLGAGDTCASILMVALSLYWVPLAADMLAVGVVPRIAAYAITLLGFAVFTLFLIVPLQQKRERDILWLGGKLLATVGSSALGIYCSLFHGTSFVRRCMSSAPNGDISYSKEHLSFLQVFRLSLDRTRFFSYGRLITDPGRRYDERVVYMLALILVALVVAAFLALRFHLARERKVAGDSHVLPV